MTKTTKLLLTLLFGLFALSAQAQEDLSLEEILEAHFEAIGQENLEGVENIKVSGKMIFGDMSIPFDSYITDDGRQSIAGEFQGQTFKMVVTPDQAWQIAPWTGTTTPQPIDDEQARQMRFQADIQGPLYDYEEKGYSLELEEPEDVEGTECYRIKLTAGEDQYSYFIDAESFVILKMLSLVNIRDQEVERESYMSNYEMVEGVAFAFSNEVKMGGHTAQQMVTESIVFNAEMEEGLFDKPETPEPAEATPAEDNAEDSDPDGNN